MNFLTGHGMLPIQGSMQRMQGGMPQSPIAGLIGGQGYNPAWSPMSSMGMVAENVGMLPGVMGAGGLLSRLGPLGQFLPSILGGAVEDGDMSLNDVNIMGLGGLLPGSSMGGGLIGGLMPGDSGGIGQGFGAGGGPLGGLVQLLGMLG